MGVDVGAEVGVVVERIAGVGSGSEGRLGVEVNVERGLGGLGVEFGETPSQV